MGGGVLFNTCSEFICFHSLEGYNFMCCVEGERGSHAAAACSSQTPSQPRQVDEWADLTCTVTAVLLELLQWGHGKRWQERISYPSLWQPVFPWLKLHPGCLLLWGGSTAAAACLVHDRWSDCMLTQPKMSAVFNLEVACCITRCVPC